jgi:hypothetical protein
MPPLKNTLAVNDAVRALPQLVSEAGAIFGNAAIRSVLQQLLQAAGR